MVYIYIYWACISPTDLIKHLDPFPKPKGKTSYQGLGCTVLSIKHRSDVPQLIALEPSVGHLNEIRCGEESVRRQFFMVKMC